MLDAKTQYELVQVLHQERLRELEQARLVQEVRKSQPRTRGVHAVILAALGRGMIALGEQMQSQGETERQTTQATS